MRKQTFVFAMALVVLGSIPAAAAERDFPRVPREIPGQWHEAIQKDLLVGQRLAQTIVADLDGDGEEEWIALSEPESKGRVYAQIYRQPKGDGALHRVWRQGLYGERFTTVRGFVTELRPFPQVIVAVAAEPFHTGDSRFRIQVIGFHKNSYRQMVPENAEIRSQGGFTIEEAQAPNLGDSLLVWTYVRGTDEMLYDYHFYEYGRFHFDGFRFAGPSYPERTTKKHPDPASAGKEIGATKPDLRRRIDVIAEIP